MSTETDTVVVADDEARRARRARLANMRQELLAPVSAIVGYGEILHDAATKGGLDEMVPDLDRILTGARDLAAMVDELLDETRARAMFEGVDAAEAQKKLRHDLRTPINAIKGYGEMLLEDLDDMGGEALEADFTTLLTETNNLLSQLNRIVDFSQTGDGSGHAGGEFGGDAGAAMFAEIVQSIRPVDAAARAVATGRILVVDDIATNRDLLARRLTNDGHQVTEAEGGKRALALLAVEDFDLVLLDLMMPDMNGFEVLARMKADENLHRIPVIMISALDEMDSVVRCIEAGAEDYLPKPFDPVLLKARISAGLEKKQWLDRERLYLERLETEKEKYERLLLNILPSQIVGRLNDGETMIADRFDNVTILFADLVGFTKLSSRTEPNQLLKYLNTLFSGFDDLANAFGVEKIKMMGDAYMVVSGVPEARENHAEAMADMALGMLDVLASVNRGFDDSCDMRVGIHSGPVVAGIIGTHRFVYDVWGDAVNVASRLESYGVAGRVQISETTARLIEERFDVERRDNIVLKGWGRVEAYYLIGRKPGTSV
ncbi:MAG: adenylate/guanylate cyclase domain-containing protein [Alphaproteobacteria bacterium]